MLQLDKFPQSDQHSIARDLELRAKNRTIAKLKRQGEQYRQFNKEIHYLMEPAIYKEAIVSQLRQKTGASQQKKAAALDAETKERVDMVNRGLVFKRTHDEISSGAYFAKKYDLDYQVERLMQKPAQESR